MLSGRQLMERWRSGGGRERESERVAGKRKRGKEQKRESERRKVAWQLGDSAEARKKEQLAQGDQATKFPDPKR